MLIKECFDEGLKGIIAPKQLAILTFDEIVDLIMITVDVLKADGVVISESQEEKDYKSAILPSKRILPQRRTSLH